MVMSPKYVTNAEGKPVEVILSLEDYQTLLEQMEILRTRALRKQLLALAPEARVTILKKQAEGMAEFYEQDSAWRELATLDDFYDADE
jgi:hypothetical protein